MRLHERLARFAPTRGEVWTYGVGSLLPFTLLALARIGLVLAGEAPPEPTDFWRVHVGEIEFWAAWGWGWWLGHRLLLRGRFPRTVAALFHALGAAWCLYSALELAYFQTTGSRADWEMLAYGFGDLARVWPVVSSELTPGRWAALAAVVAFCVSPLARRPPPGPGRRGALLWLLALAYPLKVELTRSRPEPSAPALETLQSSAFDVLFWDWRARTEEPPATPAPPEAIARVTVRPREGARHPNVVLLFLESVGADATSPYNPSLTTTPTLARMAAEGLRIDTLTAVVPHTSKALVSTVCGDWPYLHADVREARPGGLPGPCLPELLAAAGYRSAFFQPARADFEDRTALVHRMGYGRFRGRSLLEAPGFESTNYFGIDDRAMIEPGLAWSKEEPDRPFFATYLTLASHHDYTLPASWTPSRWPGVKGRRGEYLAAVHFVDTFVGDLVRAYRDADLLDDTVFVVLGDHGEGFGEHGRFQHDLVIWEEGLRVPGVIWGPGVLERRGRVEGNRQQIDVLPTVLELAGLEVTGGVVRGASLLGDAPAGRVLHHSCWRAHRCLARRDGSDKLIDLFRDGGTRRYDLATDPRERRDLASLAPAAALDALRDEARAWRTEVLGLYAARIARWREEVSVPDPSPAVATWGNRISALGCAPTVHDAIPGETVWVRCRWRAEQPLREAIRVTTETRAGGVVADGTWVPGGGELPIWEWEPGHAITDDVRVLVPADAPPGAATIALGWASYTGAALPGGPLEVPITVRPVPARAPGPGPLVAAETEAD